MIISLCLVAACVCGAIGHIVNKNDGVVWGFFLGPFGILIAAILSCRKDYVENKKRIFTEKEKKDGGVGLITLGFILFWFLFLFSFFSC